MVRLNKIYTRTGDKGTTALGDGSRVPKTHARIESYGTVDELNAVLGQLLDQVDDAAEHDGLSRIQHDLFDLGADLCLPLDEGEKADPDKPRLRIRQPSIDRLEAWIDSANASLEPLTSFVLPGGTPRASAYHMARTVCRRAERRLGSLIELEPDRVNALALVYLNRLSDLFFVLGRAAAGEHERLWVPGGGDGQ
jgi:cob(I)alamin adenosyltransferase